MDLEMTGLDPERDVIVEIATLITDDELNIVAEGPDLVIHQPEERLAGMEQIVVPRSGLALKHGISLVNTPGIIDSGYRGELKVVMINTDPTSEYQVRRGDRIAQLIIQEIVAVTWREVDELSGEDRGGGFGHSGR